MNRTSKADIAAEQNSQREIAQVNMERWLPVAITALGPALYNGGGEHAAGEWAFRCPVHSKDNRYSNGLIFSVRRGDPFMPHWWCRSCCGAAGMKPMEFLMLLARYLPSQVLPWEVAHLAGQTAPKVSLLKVTVGAPLAKRAQLLPSEGQIAAWSCGLLNMQGDNRPVDWLMQERLWSQAMIEELRIGWHYGHRAFTVPVRDAQGVLVNVKLWNPKLAKGQRWRWLIPGVNNPRLWPMPRLAEARRGERVYLCAGEPDTIAALSCGYVAVTSLVGESGGGRLRAEDVEFFAGKRVVVLYDSDATGRAGARTAVHLLRERGDCMSVRARDLFPMSDDGSDVTNWLQQGHGMPMPPARGSRAR